MAFDLRGRVDANSGLVMTHGRKDGANEVCSAELADHRMADSLSTEP